MKVLWRTYFFRYLCRCRAFFSFHNVYVYSLPPLHIYGKKIINHPTIRCPTFETMDIYVVKNIMIIFRQRACRMLGDCVHVPLIKIIPGIWAGDFHYIRSLHPVQCLCLLHSLRGVTQNQHPAPSTQQAERSWLKTRARSESVPVNFPETDKGLK
jgi:hypothetical protein